MDRSGDALKHGNFAGTSRHGAVVVLSGDDHEAKSSTMPYQDDYAFVGHGMPILYPASTGEFLTLGLHAIALSRFSGCWVAMKLVGQLADGGETVHVSPEEPGIVVPELLIDGKPFRKATDFTFFPGLNIETERQLYYERHRAVLAYARANSLAWAEVGGPGDRVGLVTAGKSYADLRQALDDLGLDDTALRRLGVRLLRTALIYPLDPEAIRGFARGLDEIVVVEEKRGFLETQVKEALAGLPQGPRVFGKADETGAPLFPIQGGMDSDLVAERLGPRLLRLADGRPDLAARIRGRLDAIRAVRARAYETHPGRTPNYCSGCPHNVGTRLLPGELAWGSPGCHSFASIIEQPERHIVSMTQLGGEGLPWIGLQPYTDRPHMVQNVGDGSLFHSSLLNIRFCVAAGANITFKILYNGFVANTGAQEMVGGKPVPELTRMLELEGVRTTVVLTKDPDAYRGAALAGNARVEAVERQDVVLKELAATPGVTALDPRRPLRQRASPPAEARAGAGAEPLRRHQRGGLRGLRALRRPDELHVPPPGRDGARAEDPGPRVVLQPGSLVPRRRLPVVRDGRDRAGDRLPAADAPGPRGRCGPGAGRASGARPSLSRLSPRRRRDRGDHDERAALLGGADRRAPRGELRPDRGRPEVGAGALEPDPLRAGRERGRQQGGARPRRPLPRARPPGGRHARQPRPLRPRADGGGRERVGPAERRDGAQRRLRAAGRRRSAPRSTATRAPTPTSPSTRGSWPRACSATT